MMSGAARLNERILRIIRELQDFGSVRNFRYRTEGGRAAGRAAAGEAPEKVGREAAAPDYDDSDWTPLTPETRFDRHQGITWLRGTYEVPAFCRDIPLAGSTLRIAAGVQIGAHYTAPIAMYADGRLLLEEPVWMDCKVPEIILTESAEAGRTHQIAVRMDCGERCYWEPSVPVLIISDAVERCYMQLESILEELSYMESFPGAAAILPQAYEVLEKGLESGGILPLVEAVKDCRKLFEPLREEVKQNKVYLISHAHIDMNWFWPMEETKKVIDRDFTTMTRLMEENADFVFSQSQCAAYAIEEEQNPAIFRKMQDFARKGQWDITATTWVENDMNLVSSESIGRQILYSKNYIREKFGIDPHVMWAPDTYGFPASLPQVFRKCGISYLFHARCGMGEEADLPYGFFDDFLRDAKHVPLYWWEGQDGSRILCCNLVYSRELSTRGVTRISRAMRERFGYQNAPYVFGVGDHGGGPTKRDIAWMREISTYPTVPTLLFSSTEAFFSQVAKDDPPRLPVRKGEINFTFAGGYTTGGYIKRMNRELERSLATLEALAAEAWIRGAEYPAGKLEALWRRTLFNQFHDTLNGSSVREVYDFLDARYREAMEEIRRLMGGQAAVLADGGLTAAGDARPVSRGESGSLAWRLYNPTDARRTEYAELPVPDADGNSVFEAYGGDGRRLPSQRTDGGLLVKVADLPPFGSRTVAVRAADGKGNEAGGGAGCGISEAEGCFAISTKYYFMEIHKESGRILTLFDKRARRYVARRGCLGWRLDQGYLNTLQIHMEEPVGMFAWMMGCVNDVRSFTRGAEAEVIERGSLRTVLRFRHRFGQSAIEQDIILYEDDLRIDFRTRVDWRETGDWNRDAPMLRVAFTPQVRSTCAVYETPFGVCERTGGDYECPSLTFADISEGDYGFALLNDCKHGYRCKGNELELALIRSSWEPDPASDVGEHVFAYAILPHEGNWKRGRVRQEAERFNRPLVVTAVREEAVTAGQGGAPAAAWAADGLLAADADDVAIFGIKVSEDGKDLVFQAASLADDSRSVRFRLGFTAEAVIECDLLERPAGGRLSLETTIFTADFGPREIKGFRIRPAARHTSI